MNAYVLQYRQRAVICLLGLAFSLAVAAPGLARADVPISNVPLFLTTSVDPNVMFILDDSGSMMFEVTPDDLAYPGSQYAGYVFPRANSVYGSNDYAQSFLQTATVDNNDPYTAMTRSPQFNTTYYNPSITYTPWVRHDNTLYPNAVAACAWHNPENTGTCPSGSVNAAARDLTRSNGRYNSNRWRSCDSDGDCASSTNDKSFWPATYYWHNGGNQWAWSDYTQVEIRPSQTEYTGHGRNARSDCTNGTCTYAQEIQNFANWYTYYRSRILASRAAIGRAFSQQSENIRVGYGALNKGATTVDNSSTSTIVRGVRPFTGAAREAFYDELYTRDIPAAGTPLRKALDDAGQYFSRTSQYGPWSSTPGASGGEFYGCRKSFTILMTDGYWSGGTDHQADTSDAQLNVDNSAGDTITSPDGDSFTYAPAHPFRDEYSNTLADVAMYYWKRDLHPTLENRVPLFPGNPAFWQHMVTYGVALGVEGTIDADDAWAAVGSATEIAWPDPHEDTDASGNCLGSTCAARLDDLLHASVNGRGGFFSAADPITFATEFSKVLDDIVAQVEESATSAAASAAVIQTDTLLYLAGFRSGDWSGELHAYEIEANGDVGALEWDAELQLANATPSDRNIYTRNSDSGSSVKLDLSLLSTEQQDALAYAPDGTQDALAAERVAWLRGVENNQLRSRTVLGFTRRLGDIVHSSPQFVGKTNFGYSLLSGAEGTAYGPFRASTNYANRPSAIYVGANDGMLHAFHATTGNELFAYMPSELLQAEDGKDHARINDLMDPGYAHRYYVDGTATISDGYVDGSWKTILVGTMGAGGRTVFALDVTNPTNFDESKVLWEFTHEDLGYGVTTPSIVRMRNGEWAAVFGNGYNSDDDTAGLFIVPLAAPSGAIFVPTDDETANGLGPVVVSDWPEGDMNARKIYAGDLHGRMWRFDVSATNANQWDNANNRSVLFQAEDADEVAQPITAKPQVAAHPTDPDALMVLFGTGSYFLSNDGDLSDPQTQTFYGLMDTGDSIAGRSDLNPQEITWQGDRTFTTEEGSVTYTLRQVSREAVPDDAEGWYLDLAYEGVNGGERVISEPTFPLGAPRDRVRFSTLIPDNDPCGTGRRGFLMELDLASGGAPLATSFDLNRDGNFDDDDKIEGEPVSGAEFGGGEKITTVRSRDGKSDHVYEGDGANPAPPALRSGSVPPGRQSWRQLR